MESKFFFNYLGVFSFWGGEEKYKGVLILELAAHGGLAHLASSGGATTNNASVNSAPNAVSHLDVELGHSVHLIGGGLLNVSHRRVVHNVLDSEAGHGLVLYWLAAAAIAGHLVPALTAVVAVASVVSTLDRH